MNILLLNPPNKNTIEMEDSNEIVKEHGSYPPLGLLYLASSIKKFSKYKHNIKIIDSFSENLDFKDIEKTIKNFNPDLIGITAYTPILYDALKTLKLAKKINPKIITVIGGHHSDLYPKETLSQEGIDFAILGEAEYTLPNLIDNIIEKSSISKIKGIAYKKKDKIIINGKHQIINKLDDLPFPAYELIDLNKYQCLIDEKKFTASIITSRGCPYKCTFCSKPLKQELWRPRSPKNVVDEIECLYNKGIREFFFADENFNVNPKRVRDICKEIQKRDIKIYWSFRGRVNQIDEKTIKECKKAGCRRIHFGIERANDKDLKYIRKDITINMIVKAIRLCKKYKITTLGNFMIGFPDETKKQMLRIADFANRLRLDYASFQIISAYPNTQLYSEMLSKGIIKKDIWKRFAEKPIPNFKAPSCSNLYSKKQLLKMVKACLRRFYFNPQRMISMILSVRSPKEFISRLKGALYIIKR